MAGKQAKVLAADQISLALRRATKGRNGPRNRLILLLSIKAGLRAGEIANLTWPMVCDATGAVGDAIELQDWAAKKQSGRSIPIHPDVKSALTRLRRSARRTDGPVIRSQRGEAMTAHSLVNWFREFYARLGLDGCTSHSGRRTFITRAARLVHRAGGSLRDVQQLAGHRSIEQTQAYIDGDTLAKRRLVALL
jgi:integrase/recombinase XerD